jgi:SAM-dependent methyltransferase
MSPQNRTLDRYQELMQINAASHVLRTARQVGLFDQLRSGQKTADQLAETLRIDRSGLDLLLECLITLNVIERYEDDHALAPVMQLLCQYDSDLGDASWHRLLPLIQGESAEAPGRAYLDSLAATQWIHTPAAMQAAEMLDMGGPTGPMGKLGDDGLPEPLRILDLGCGSAVWSCAMAYRDGQATIVAVDDAAPLAAATSTASAIQLNDRFETRVGDPETIELGDGDFGLVVIAQRLHATTDAGRKSLIDKAYDSLAPGGRVVVIDLFRGPTKPSLTETIEALRVHAGTGGTGQGRMQSIEELQSLLKQRGLTDIRFTFIEASRVNFGMMVATK